MDQALTTGQADARCVAILGKSTRRANMTTDWIERNKNERPFEAGALAYATGSTRYYGCHYGMRSTLDWAKERFYAGYDAAQHDSK